MPDGAPAFGGFVPRYTLLLCFCCPGFQAFQTAGLLNHPPATRRKNSRPRTEGQAGRQRNEPIGRRRMQDRTEAAAAGEQRADFTFIPLGYSVR